MTYIRSFDDARPPPRFDGRSFNAALIQESVTHDGAYTTIDTISLTTDADPAVPAYRDLTTSAATLSSGWYRINWRDAVGGTFASQPVQFPSFTADLTSLAAVRSFLQKGTDDTGQDPIISSLITSASVEMMRYAGREFAPVTSAVARTFEWQVSKREKLLSLVPYDLRSLSAVILDTDLGNTTPLDASQYRLYPVPNNDGVYTAIEFTRSLCYPIYPWSTRQVEVTGDWGFASVPADVEMLCREQVKTWLRQDVAAFESTRELDMTRLERPQTLSGAVRAGLGVYRRGEILG